MIQEFKDFIMKGNVLELAIAVIIAGAFGAVVTSFTSDVLMPPIGKALGGVDFSQLEYVIDPAIAEVKDASGAVVTAGKDAISVRYGKWINTIIDFLIISLILFMIIRAYNKANPEPEPEPAPEPGPTQEDLLGEIRDLLAKR